jgi:hypothetical protein
MQPGVFDLAAGTYDNPSQLVVGPSSWWRELSTDEPLLEIPVSSVMVAESIVRDYANGLIECNMNDIMPGLFFMPGVVPVDKLKKEHKSILDFANTKQNNWYLKLIEMGDILWARTQGNPLSISNDMRIAAKALGKEKDWLKNYTNTEVARCKACGTMINTSIIVCPNCKVILDAERFKSLGLNFAS